MSIVRICHLKFPFYRCFTNNNNLKGMLLILVFLFLGFSGLTPSLRRDDGGSLGRGGNFPGCGDGRKLEPLGSRSNDRRGAHDVRLLGGPGLPASDHNRCLRPPACVSDLHAEWNWSLPPHFQWTGVQEEGGLPCLESCQGGVPRISTMSGGPLECE